MRTLLSPRAGYGRGEEEMETKGGEDGGGGDFGRVKRLRMWRKRGEGAVWSAALTSDSWETNHHRLIKPFHSFPPVVYTAD